MVNCGVREVHLFNKRGKASHNNLSFIINHLSLLIAVFAFSANKTYNKDKSLIFKLHTAVKRIFNG